MSTYLERLVYRLENICIPIHQCNYQGISNVYYWYYLVVATSIMDPVLWKIFCTCRVRDMFLKEASRVQQSLVQTTKYVVNDSVGLRVNGACRLHLLNY